MKKVFALMLVFAMMLLVGGCLTDSGSDETDDSGSNATNSAATYMPFKQGTVWTYTDTETSFGTPPIVNTTTSITTCTGQETINGKVYWVMSESDNYSSMYIRVQDNDVYIYGNEFMYAKAAPKVAQEIPEEVLMFRFGVSSGTTWQIWSGTSSGEGYSYTVAVTGKYVGKETVTTPAGKYSNCVRFDTTTTTTSVVSGITQTFAFTSSMWFAPNVGPVKTYESEEQMGITFYQYESLLSSYVP